MTVGGNPSDGHLVGVPQLAKEYISALRGLGKATITKD
jgi:hypothetical protein